MTVKERKASFKTMLKLFEDLWLEYAKNNSTFINDWNKILEDNKWTDEEFDLRVTAMGEEEVV